MIDLATIDDVTAILQRELTPAEVTNATRLLGMASAVVRRYTRQTLTQVLNDSITLPGNWEQALVLPQRPVTAVHSVVINGVTLPSVSYVLNDNVLFLSTGSYSPDFGPMNWGNFGLMGPAGSVNGPQYSGPSWQGPASRITVSYDHGYDEVPGDIVNIVAGMVAFAIASPVGVNMERVGGYQVAYSRSEGGSMALQEADKKALADYRRRSGTTSIAPLR